MGGFPNFGSFLAQVWDSEFDVCAGLGFVSNVVLGGNPPYSISDFLNMFPKFAGPPTPTEAATIANSSSTVTLAAPGLSGVLPGQLVIGPGIQPGSVTVTVASTTSFTMNLPATQDQSGVPISVYQKPLVPLFAINAYISLAVSSLAYARWGTQWAMAIAYYVAHFCTLYCLSEGTGCDLGAPAGAVAARGLKQGVQISGSAGGVSQSMQVVDGLQDWGAWNQTQYGVQLATWGKTNGAGPMFLW